MEATRSLDPDRGRSRFLSAARWTVIGHGLSQVLSLASSLVLTRLLVPEVYGLMELVWVFIAGLTMFSDLGIGPCVVQSARGDDERFLQTAWTLQALRGLMLTLAAIALGQPMAMLFGQESLAYYIPATGLIALFDGLSSMSVFSQERKLRLDQVVRLEVLKHAITIIVQVCIALIWPSVWVLIIGAWVGSLVRCVGSHYLLEPIAHRFTWEPRAAREIFAFGRWVFGSTALHFLSNQGDRVVLARVHGGMDLLGVYALALRLKNTVQNLHLKLVRSLVFPALAEKNRALAEEESGGILPLTRFYDRARLGLDALFLTGAGALMVLSVDLVAIVYDELYAPAGWILRILSVELAMGILLATPEVMLTAMGHTKYGFYRSAGRALWVICALPLAWYLFGAEGLIWSIALVELPTLVVIWRAAITHGFFSPWREARSLGFFLGGVVLGFGLDKLLRLIVERLGFEVLKGL